MLGWKVHTLPRRQSKRDDDVVAVGSGVKPCFRQIEEEKRHGGILKKSTMEWWWFADFSGEIMWQWEYNYYGGLDQFDQFYQEMQFLGLFYGMFSLCKEMIFKWVDIGKLRMENEPLNLSNGDWY